MSKKPDTAAALAGILKAKRGDNGPADPPPPAGTPAEAETPPPPSPALPPVPPRVEAATSEFPARKGRGGKSSDPNYSQFSIYLPKALRKKVGRHLDDADAGQDFSELVEDLLRQWVASRT